MYLKRTKAIGYLVTFLFGVLGGGLIIALVTKAIPKMIRQITSDLSQTMMSRMREYGVDPAVL